MGKPTALLGIVYVLLFTLFSSVQEVYLGNLFQTTDPILVTFWTFVMSAAFFLALHLRHCKQFAALFKRHSRDIFWANIFTAISWLGFFVSLKYIEPAVSSTTTFALCPILTILFWKLLRPGSPVTKTERITSAGILVGYIVLVVGTFLGKSGVGDIAMKDALIGIILATISGIGVVGGTFFSKRLSDKQLSAQTVMAMRFFLLILISFFLMPTNASPPMTLQRFIVTMTILSLFTIIAPLFILQLGIEKCEPITVTLLLSLIPVFTYLIQLMDSRLVPSLYSGVGIFLYLACSVAGVWSRYRVQ